MFKPIKARLRRTKEFTVRHQTLIACTATAAVTCVVTREYHLAKFGRVLRFVYMENGAMLIENGVLRKFVEDKGLKDEFLKDFIPNL